MQLNRICLPRILSFFVDCKKACRCLLFTFVIEEYWKHFQLEQLSIKSSMTEKAIYHCYTGIYFFQWYCSFQVFNLLYSSELCIVHSCKNFFWSYHSVWKSTKNVSFSRTICIFVCIWIFGPKVIKINGARFARSQWGKMRLFEWFLNTMNILQIVYVLLDVPRKFWDVFSSRLNSSIFGTSD